MKRIICFVLLAALLVFPVRAEGAKEIHTVDDLLAIAEDPAGSYILMENLDMTGVEWKALDFSGTFDGNGKALLNLSITEPGDRVYDSCDGNQKLYPSRYYGLFGTVENAEIRDLNLIGVNTVVTSDEPCFLAGIAGCTLGTTAITGCTVTGSLELRAHDSIFGVGGIVGYGTGTIRSCNADVTLITVDTDATTVDEQFLGGIYATGYIDTFDCTIKIDGYISEHGYVHSGGVIGMYMRYPLGEWRFGEVSGNSVEGKITFFEDNKDRRAYCKGDVGEVLANNYRMRGNLAPRFLRDERSSYTADTELRPEMCSNPQIKQTTVEGSCTEFGYNEYTCSQCSYTFRAEYTLPAHRFGDWTVEKEATEEETGLRTSKCQDCGETVTEVIPMLEPTQPTTLPETEPTETEPLPTAGSPLKSSRRPGMLIASIVCLGLSAVLLITALVLGRKK